MIMKTITLLSHQFLLICLVIFLYSMPIACSNYESSPIVISDLKYLGQSEIASSVLLFKAKFKDATQKLINGNIIVLLDDNNGQIILPIWQFYDQNHLPLDCFEGELFFSVHLNFDNASRLQGGFDFSISFIFENASGEKSNKKTIYFTGFHNKGY